MDNSDRHPSRSPENGEQSEPDANRTGSTEHDSTSDDDEDDDEVGEGAEDRNQPMVLNSNSRAVDLFSLFSHIVRSARGSGGGGGGGASESNPLEGPAEPPSRGQYGTSRSDY